MIEVNRILNTHVLDGLKQLPNSCIDMVLTSPPYWGIRELPKIPKRPDVQDQLESRARSIRKRLKENQRPTPRSLLEEEIAFTVEKLDRLREIQKEQLDDIHETRFRIVGYLKRLDKYREDPRRDIFHSRILRLDEEQRRRHTIHERDVRDMQNHLRSLLTQHAHLDDEPDAQSRTR